MASTTCTPRPVMPPGRRLVAVLPPVIAAEAVGAGPAEIAFDMQQLAEPAVGEHAGDLLQRRLKAPIVADGERNLVLGTGLHRGRRLRGRQSQRLLGEDMLARARGGDDLLRMHGVWRGQYHRIDRRVGQHRLEARLDGNAMAAAEFLGACRRAGGAGDEPDQVAPALHAFDEVLAPIPHPDDCRAHCGGHTGIDCRSLPLVHVPSFNVARLGHPPGRALV